MTASSASDDSPLREEYSIERVVPEHYPFLVILYADAFDVTITATEIEKRFDTTALGMRSIGFIAIHKSTNTPAGYCGVFPFKAIINGEEVQAAQRGDTMTHSQHRKKGLFILLGEATQLACKNEGIKILISQPNVNSYPATVNKLGWTKVDEIVRWDLKLKLKTFPLAKVARKVRLLKNIYSSYVRRVFRSRTVDAASFHNTVQTDYAKVNRDANYLSYKKTTDKYFIKIDGVVIWIKLTDVLWIGDFSDYEKVSPIVLKKLRRLAFILGYNTISFNFNKSLSLPAAFQAFNVYNSEPSCMLYLDDAYKNINFVLTGADFDTW